MKKTNEPHVGLDSQCLSYLLDGIAGINEPTDSLAEEKKALLRSWFYKPGSFTFFLTETVISEISQIRNIDRREFHKSFISTLFRDYPVQNLNAVQARAAKFALTHPKHNDCRILAEAEELELDFVLTYDHNFWKRLSNVSHTTKLLKPSAYWATLGIANGMKPVTVPHPTNPLSQQSWWRW
jgi:hypothetical protein